MTVIKLLRFSLVLFGLSVGADAASGAVKLDSRGLTVRTPLQTTRVEFWDEHVVRVIHANGDALQLTELDSFVIVGEPRPVEWTSSEVEGGRLIRSSRLNVQVSTEDGSVSILDASEEPILCEVRNGTSIKANRAGVADTFRIEQQFTIDPSEAFYGLGQHQRGVMNWSGHKVHLRQRNTEVAVPVLLSSAGYLVLWDNPAVTDIDVGQSESGRLVWTSEAGQAVDYYVCVDRQPDAMIAAYRRLTGAAPMFPRWVWGFWQCKERYSSQRELLDVLAGYRERKIPLDGIIQDWQYWKAGEWGSHEFEPSRYPDPAAMVDEIHRQGAHAIVSLWPRFDEGTDNHEELEAAGAFYPPLYPNVYPQGYGKWYDPFCPTGRAVYWRQVSSRLASLGFDGWWLDASEAELGGNWGQMRNLETAAGPGAEVYNAYPLMHTKAVYEGHRADIPEKRAFLLTRSAFAGQQRNAAVTWSGDIQGSWSVFSRQIPAGLNFVATGIPYWNTDIGGFFGGNPNDPSYAELFTRWFQFGAFCPMFRVHGTGAGKEVWRFDSSTQTILEDFIRLRYRLLPYIYATSWKVTHEGYTMMRPLVMDFFQDAKVFNVADQFMFGPALLASPVIHQGVQARDVYLPCGKEEGVAANAAWVDFWTGRKYSAGEVVNAPSPIAIMPLFVRAGSIIPLGPAVEYSSQQHDPIELRVYSGADGDFILYEDEGDGYGYEHERYATIPIHWDDVARTLTIGARQGDFPGLDRDRRFHVVWVGPGHGVGIDAEESPDAELIYSGDAVSVTASRSELEQ
ncbi:MAG: DUF5110 domain-containing protein [Pirellulales bacterium]|nr:DUF5110 domain-containing protein [Pirellulales bacterium]